MSPLGVLYDAASRFSRAMARPVAAPVPVICIGNLVAGGAGKTPVALALGRRLLDQGISAHFLSRGYGGSLTGPVRVDADRHDFRAVGDEPLLLAALAPTWIARERITGARAAAAAGAQVILMDDGLQNRSLQPDLVLIAIDGGYGFGNGRVMPAGPLREALRRGFDRAHAAVVIGRDRLGIATELSGILPVVLGDLRPRAGDAPWRGRRFHAFAGIGRPQKFFDTLLDLGADLARACAFPDHHPYRPAELAGLAEAARADGAALVTTAKDYLRLPAAFRAQVRVLDIDLVWRRPQDIEAIDQLFVPLWPRITSDVEP